VARSESKPKEHAVRFFDGRFDEQHVVVIAARKPGESLVAFELGLGDLYHVLIGKLVKTKASLWSRDKRIFKVAVGPARHTYLDVGRRSPFFEELSKLPMIAFKFVESVDEEANAVAG
jgi:hypothetical protein